MIALHNFVIGNKRVPAKHEVYNGYNVGSFYDNLKTKLKNGKRRKDDDKDDDKEEEINVLRNHLWSMHPLIMKSIDDFIQRRKVALTKEDKLKLLQQFCQENQRCPNDCDIIVPENQSDPINLGSFYAGARRSIKRWSLKDKAYAKLASLHECIANHLQLLNARNMHKVLELHNPSYDTPDTIDTLDTLDTQNVPDVPGTPDTIDTLDTLDIEDTQDTQDTQDTLDTQDDLDTQNVPDTIPDVPGTPDNIDTPDTQDAPGTPTTCTTISTSGTVLTNLLDAARIIENTPVGSRIGSFCWDVKLERMENKKCHDNRALARLHLLRRYTQRFK